LPRDLEYLNEEVNKKLYSGGKASIKEGTSFTPKSQRAENQTVKIGAIIGTLKKYTKFQSIALEEEIIVSTIFDFDLARDKNLKIDLSSFSGIFVFTLNALIKDHIANANEFGLVRIKEYLENGGKVCFLLQPLSSEQNSKLIEHFGVTTIEEFIVGEGPGKGDVKFSMDGNRLCPLFNCKIGTHLISKSDSSGAPGSYTGPFIGSYLNMRKSAIILEKVMIQSEKSNLERVVSCKIKQGAGEAWYISDFTGLYASSVRVNDSDLFSDTTIDYFQNTEAARAIIKWLIEPLF